VAETFHAGDVVLQSGVTLPDAQLVYEVHGRLNAARDNAIVFPSRFGGTHADNAYLIGIEFGVEASILLACGVSGEDLVSGDRNEHRITGTATEDFVDPHSILA